MLVVVVDDGGLVSSSLVRIELERIARVYNTQTDSFFVVHACVVAAGRSANGVSPGGISFLPFCMYACSFFIYWYQYMPTARGRLSTTSS